MKVMKKCHPRAVAQKPARFEKWRREGLIASVWSVEKFILEHENKNTAQKLKEM